MTSDKNQEMQPLSDYIKGVRDQEIKVLLLKLKNELGKEDVLWAQVKPLLRSIREKNSKVMYEILPLIL